MDAEETKSGEAEVRVEVAVRTTVAKSAELLNPVLPIVSGALAV